MQARLDQGIHVGELARDYVPGGVLIDFPHQEIDKKAQATNDAIRNGAEIIYEASFFADGVFVAVDILEKMGKGWNLLEVKSTTKAKPEHIPDVAVQTHVLKSAGLKVNRAYLMHLNRECRYPDLGNLFSRTGLTTEAEDDAVLRDVACDVLEFCFCHSGWVGCRGSKRANTLVSK